jgi:serine/threonine protein kinase
MDIDVKSPPFDRFRRIQRLAPERSGRDSVEHARHLLYVGLDDRSWRTGVLIKVASRPGIVYQHNLSNEIASLTTINRELPDSPHFPTVHDHGRLRDGRVYMIASLFEELPLATVVGTERNPAKMVAHLRTTLEVATALADLHRLEIFHVDLNPMNILYKMEKGKPAIRIVDFESSYEVGRHSAGEFYNPPTTPQFTAPEVPHQAPDARSDVFSLGAVLYTLLAGYQWTWKGDVASCVSKDEEIDPELQDVLLKSADQRPERRYSSMVELRDALAAYLERIWPGRSW